MPGDGRRVAGLVELEVLGVVGLLLLGVVLGHGGRGRESRDCKADLCVFLHSKPVKRKLSISMLICLKLHYSWARRV